LHELGSVTHSTSKTLMIADYSECSCQNTYYSSRYSGFLVTYGGTSSGPIAMPHKSRQKIFHLEIFFAYLGLSFLDDLVALWMVPLLDGPSRLLDGPSY
jgi:hypothetical protein